VTLVASLHAVDLALAHFPRWSACARAMAFDCPATAVTQGLLDALYANEQLGSPVAPGPTLTVQIPRC
jgi:phosphonate transport system ATP-binding protein